MVFAKARGLVVTVAVLTLLSAMGSFAADEIPDSDAVMTALVDELARSMEMQLTDLEKPYFIHYTVEDSLHFSLQATYGALVGDDSGRSSAGAPRRRLVVHAGTHR